MSVYKSFEIRQNWKKQEAAYELEKSTEPETESKSDTEEIQGQAGAAPKYIWEPV